MTSSPDGSTQTEVRTTIGEGSKVTLRVVLVLCSFLSAGIVYLVTQSFQIRESVGKDLDERLSKYVSTDLFHSEIDALRRENQIRFDTIQAGLTELRLRPPATPAGR